MATSEPQLNPHRTLVKAGSSAPAKLSENFDRPPTREEAARMIDQLLTGYGLMIKDLPDPDGYMANLLTIVTLFPVGDALAGCEHCALHCPYLPSRFELNKACQDHRSARLTKIARDRRLERQLAERELPPRTGPTQTVPEVRAEMRARGLPMPTGRVGDRAHRETPMSVMIKLGLSQEEWDAIPAAPPAGSWERLQAKHRAPEPEGEV